MRGLGLFTSVVALSAVLTVGCGTGEAPAPLAQAASPIIDGVRDDETNDDVVLIETDLGGGRATACTGTLVAHKVIVTARHCVSQIQAGSYDVAADYDPAKMYVWLGTTPLGPPDAYGAKLVHDGATNLVNHDLAVLVLDRRIGAKLSPLRLSGPATIGETVKVVGYGLTQTDTTPLTNLHERYQRENLAVLELGPGTFFTPMTYDLASSELSLGESICEGDSGGPMKDQTSGALLAVTSRGGNGTGATPYPFSGCLGARTVNTFTRVDDFAKLITDAIASVGEQPWLEGEPQPAAPPAAALGGACVGTGDCVAGTMCVSRDGTSHCSQSCRTAACPDGFQCVSNFCFANGAVSGSDAGTTPPTPAPASSGGCALAAATVPTRTSELASGSAWLALALAGAARRRRP
jgi:hypothetical protein